MRRIRGRRCSSACWRPGTVALSGVERRWCFRHVSGVALGMRQFRILLIRYAVLVGMSLLAGCAFGMSLRSSMPAFSAVSLVVPFLRMATMLNVILPLANLPGAEPADRPERLRLPFCLYLPAAVMIVSSPRFA
ncbi:MAG: hypothetical protein ACLSAH_08960 [Bilophila wadsworthia]